MSDLHTELDWIGDYCTDTGFICDTVHAAGLVKLHAPCTPPCPRVQAAHKFLAREAADRR